MVTFYLTEELLFKVHQINMNATNSERIQNEKRCYVALWFYVKLLKSIFVSNDPSGSLRVWIYPRRWHKCRVANAIYIVRATHMGTAVFQWRAVSAKLKFCDLCRTESRQSFKVHGRNTKHKIRIYSWININRINCNHISLIITVGGC